VEAWQPVPLPTVVLVDESGGKLNAHELGRLATALTTQVRDHLGAAWLTAPVTVTVEPNPPQPVWKISIYDQTPAGAAAGFHQSEHLQPYANVDLSISGDAWTVVVSHELLEMLVDPWGYRMWWARAPERFPRRRGVPLRPLPGRGL